MGGSRTIKIIIVIINEHKQKHLNKEVLNYISAIQVAKFDSFQVTHTGSISEQKIQDFTLFESSEVIIYKKLGQYFNPTFVYFRLIYSYR